MLFDFVSKNKKVDAVYLISGTSKQNKAQLIKLAKKSQLEGNFSNQNASIVTNVGLTWLIQERKNYFRRLHRFMFIVFNRAPQRIARNYAPQIASCGIHLINNHQTPWKTLTLTIGK